MNQYGLTLVEVIIAALILSLTIGGVLFMFTAENIAVFRTGHRLEANDYAREVLDILRNAVDAQAWQEDTGQLRQGSHNAEPFLSLAGTELGDNFGGNRVYTVDPAIDQNSDGEQDYKRLTITVDWNER